MLNKVKCPFKGPFEIEKRTYDAPFDEILIFSSNGIAMAKLTVYTSAEMQRIKYVCAALNAQFSKDKGKK